MAWEVSLSRTRIPRGGYSTHGDHFAGDEAWWSDRLGFDENNPDREKDNATAPAQG
jgi:hypothetical protein